MAATKIDVLDMSATTSSRDLATALRPARPCKRVSITPPRDSEKVGSRRTHQRFAGADCSHLSAPKSHPATGGLAPLEPLQRVARLLCALRRQRGSASLPNGAPDFGFRVLLPLQIDRRGLWEGGSAAAPHRTSEGSVEPSQLAPSAGAARQHERGTSKRSGDDGPSLLPRKGRAPRLD